MHCNQNKADVARKDREDKRAREKPGEDSFEKRNSWLCGAEIPSLSSLAGEQAGSHNGQQIPRIWSTKGGQSSTQ